MNDTYFSSEKAMGRFFYIIGNTSDEFYTEGLMQLNIEQLVHMELKKAGYRRVIFLDKFNKLYTYDDESYSLYNTRGENIQNNQVKPASQMRAHRGLKNGMAGHRNERNERSGAANGADNDKSADSDNSSDWTTGRASGIKIKNIKSDKLHLGSKDDFMVSRAMEAYMEDKYIKTAIVINDPNSFLQDFQNEMHSYTTKYKRMLGPENENIIVFIFPEENQKNIFDIKAFEKEDTESANVIRIGKPEASEIRNMLVFLRYKKNLKLKMSELDRIAVSLHQAAGLAGIDIAECYKKVERFAMSGRTLNGDISYEMLGVDKPRTAEEQLQSLIGMQSVKDALLSYKIDRTDKYKITDTPLRIKPQPVSGKANDAMIHFIITGNPGTGKTTVAKLIGQLFYEMGYLKDGHVVETDRQGLVGQYIGETAIKTRNKVLEALGGVLFVDEAYALSRNNGNNNPDFGKEAIDTLVKAMDEFKGQFILVAAGYKKEMDEFLKANPGLPRRFSGQLNIDDYTPEEMKEILVFQARKKGYVISEELMAELPNFCENWVNQADETWGNAGEAVTLVEAADRSWNNDEEHKSSAGYKVLEKKHFPEEKMAYFKPVDEIRNELIEKFNNLTGLSGVKDKIKRMRLDIKYGSKTIPGHYIFVGNPGTGKTTVASYMGELMRSFRLLKRGHVVPYAAQDLISAYAENNGDIRSLFDKAVDGVLFIDEAYQLTDSHVGESIKGALLPYAIDHEKDMCIVLAGYEEDMKRFFETNPGLKSRFSETIHFENYSGIELHSILIEHLKDHGKKFDADYEENAKRILVRTIPEKSKEKSFSNARYIIKEFIPACEARMHERLEKTMGDDFDENAIVLTGTDFPEELMMYTVEKLKDVSSESAIEKIKKLKGFDEIKMTLENMISTVEAARSKNMPQLLQNLSFHWVLKGNPGTGKTMIANMIGAVYKDLGLLPKADVIVAKRQDLVAGYVGQTAIKTQDMVDKAMGGILFIDEAYTLSSPGTEHNFGKEAIDTLLEQMSSKNGKFGVIAAGYPQEMEEFLNTNPGLRSRFGGNIFELPDYTDAELADIFVSMCGKKLFVADDELKEQLPKLFAYMRKRNTDKWANAREAENLERRMLFKWNRNTLTKTDEEGHQYGVLTLQDIPDEYIGFLDALNEVGIDEESILSKINELIGFRDVKEKLSAFVSLVNASRKEDQPSLLNGLSYHWVIKGNPGTGKTTVAKLVGQVYRDLGLLPKGHVIVARRQDLVAGYVGQTALKTQEVINKAIGGILFIDEAYTLSSPGAEHNFGKEAIDTLLEQMSARNGEFGVIVAGYPKEMDQFINSNPGLPRRFEQEFVLEDYTAQELADIFRLMVKKEDFEVDERLDEALTSLFDLMIKKAKADKNKNWGNAGECENLVRRMKYEWARNTVTRIDDNGQKHMVFTIDHLPAGYKEILEKKSEIEAKEREKSAEKTAMANFSIPADKLITSDLEFDYESAKQKGFIRQRMGTAFIRCISAQGEGHGTGSLITKDGYILTCEHVIRDGDKITVMLKQYDEDKVTSVWYDARTVWFDNKIDLAVIKIEDDHLPALELSDTSLEYKGGESIFMLGYPFGGRVNDKLDDLEVSFFSGDIASKQVKESEIRFLVGMEGKQGNSGGPVFDAKNGKIIGVFCGSQIFRGEALTEEVNFFRPVSYIWDRIIKA